eukprot:Gb_03344 [translate_table: standard]
MCSTRVSLVEEAFGSLDGGGRFLLLSPIGIKPAVGRGLGLVAHFVVLAVLAVHGWMAHVCSWLIGGFLWHLVGGCGSSLWLPCEGYCGRSLWRLFGAGSHGGCSVDAGLQPFSLVFSCGGKVFPDPTTAVLFSAPGVFPRHQEALCLEVCALIVPPVTV